MSGQEFAASKKNAALGVVSRLLKILMLVMTKKNNRELIFLFEYYVKRYSLSFITRTKKETTYERTKKRIKV